MATTKFNIKIESKLYSCDIVLPERKVESFLKQIVHSLKRRSAKVSEYEKGNIDLLLYTEAAQSNTYQEQRSMYVDSNWFIKTKSQEQRRRLGDKGQSEEKHPYRFKVLITKL